MVDKYYLRSLAGLLKIGQFIFLVVSFSCLAHFMVEADEKSDGFKFFLAVTIGSWIIVMTAYSFFSIYGHHLHSVNWTTMMIILSGVEALLLVIASSILAENAHELRQGSSFDHDKHQPKCTHYGDHHVRCSNVEAAVVFGFTSAALFVADFVYYFVKHRSLTNNRDEIGLQKGAITTHYNTDHVEKNSAFVTNFSS